MRILLTDFWEFWGMQSQYLFSGHGGDGEWVVPVTYCVGAYKNKMSELVRLKTSVLSTHKLIHDKQANSDSDMTSQDSSPDLSKDWIKLNVGQTGFYRVKYDDELALRLRSAISAGSLEATDRFGVCLSYSW